MPRVYGLFPGPSLSFKSLYWRQDSDKVLCIRHGTGADRTGLGHHHAFSEAASPGRGAGGGGDYIDLALRARFPVASHRGRSQSPDLSSLCWAQQCSERSRDSEIGCASPHPDQMYVI